MDKLILPRRQLLYLGLGLAGTGAATALGLITRPDQANTPKLNSTQNSDTNSSPVAAKPSTTMVLPEFQGIQTWLNSAPLTKKDLQGQVVLIQFWTLGCINCQRTLPYVTRWHQQFAGQGLKIVGVHTPEFPFERRVSNIQAAIKKHNIQYPVAVDNDFKTWRAYQNEYWPHLFLADRQGMIRYDHIGEGAYPETAQMIQTLLKA